MDLITLWLFFATAQYLVATIAYSIAMWCTTFGMSAIVRVVLVVVVTAAWPLLLPYYLFCLVEAEAEKRG